MKTAYEKWLIEQVENDSDKVLSLTYVLYYEAFELGNRAAMDLLDKTGDTEWTWETIKKASQMVLEI